MVYQPLFQKDETMKPLKKGQFYVTEASHFLWQHKNKEPNQAKNRIMATLPAGTLVMFTGFTKVRYLQVVWNEQIGFIWCNTNIPFEQILVAVNPDEFEPINPPRKAHRRVQS